MYKRSYHIHFVGIGGIGMSGIAELLLNLGHQVSGSDIQETEITRRLETLGATISYSHQPQQVAGADAVVVSSAIDSDNPEVAAANMDYHIPVIRRAEMLAELMRLKYAVLVAGAHGKTTTTSMVGTVMAEGGLDPTVIIGGRLNAWGTNAKLGQGDFVVAEADESDGTFLLYSPTISLVTNIDTEHLDFYKDLDEIKETFLEFINQVPFYGLNILCLEDENIQGLLPRIKKRMVTYGFSAQADFQARDLAFDGLNVSYRAFYCGQELGKVTLPIPGQHNALNSLAAVAVGHELEIPFSAICRGLQEMTGVQRRFQIKGEVNGVTVIDDYGHHPTEIKAVLKTMASSFPGRRRLVLFQPHRYTRTQALFEDFTTAFYQSDVLIVTEIYAASEPVIPGVHAEKLTTAIQKHGHGNVRYIPDHLALVPSLVEEVRGGDVVLTLGAGNIWQTGEALLEKLKERKKADN
ncbi:MAG: UDP-N-acetylmuramate--L-alanine ligase [Syntrophobacteria bacterium]|jgi:UDP-N-acetylmuramate--alanine ligase|nr:UDP-N-acetylmuramate--L-alanine ligase [Deltaproteobacteria bacterium]PNV86863.1 MAG: UDP-N-acetylmuramate--L-alanine ligase [Desulfobacteraceae bacterium]MDH3852051.1 UDP-N-acetylmuramate--L-alanine ligase [Deltaproteobacteria bacterium]MDH3896802.1 UDP-N-acetylmuramate--L-alanine ligase [Deltaproteobacteria bacterium]MDH3926551.1 UDP-N-acetylmuramate--L-alanine ligase [Deltaproteobacteria bacterium]